MLTLHRSKCIVVCISVISLVLLATSCAPAATPTPTPPPAATQPPSSTAPAAAVATPTPPEEEIATPTADAVGTAGVSPDDMPRISLEELKQLMDSGAKITILDNRPRESYQMGHIKGAISFPWKPELTEDDLEFVPFGRSITITYCGCGPGEADSADIAVQLIELGVEGDFKVLADPSIEGWIEAGYPTE